MFVLMITMEMEHRYVRNVRITANLQLEATALLVYVHMKPHLGLAAI